MNKQTLPESICFWTYVMTWPLYLVGALYIVVPVLAWMLFFLFLVSAYLGPAIRPDVALTGRVPPLIWIWIVGMLVMLFALWVGHLNWGLGMGQTIKSSIGWAKGWAMIPIFMLIGAVFQIRRDVLIRAQTIVGLSTLLIFPMMLIAPSIGLPSKLFISPLQATGGPGPEYFSIYLYTMDPETMTPRWQFYAPWSPFAGLIGVVMAIFSTEEKNRFWRNSGLLGGLVQIYFSKSRMSLVGLAVCLLIPRLLPMLKRTSSWFGLTLATSSLAVFGAGAANLIEGSIQGFKSARASSSRVRDTIQSIGYYRWYTEAFWFGHGTVTRGPHIVEFMPIGSHHTWYGLLFVKGFVGFVSLLVPLLSSLISGLIDAIRGPRGRLPFALLLNFVILTFGENLEIEVYLLWPAFVILGIHAREMMDDDKDNKKDLLHV
jgi:hypothetical protein